MTVAGLWCPSRHKNVTIQAVRVNRFYRYRGQKFPVTGTLEISNSCEILFSFTRIAAMWPGNSEIACGKQQMDWAIETCYLGPIDP